MRRAAPYADETGATNCSEPTIYDGFLRDNGWKNIPAQTGTPFPARPDARLPIFPVTRLSLYLPWLGGLRYCSVVKSKR